MMLDFIKPVNLTSAAFRRTIAIALSSAAIAGCISSGPSDASPGLNHREIQALSESYYWKPEFGVPSYSDEDLARLLASSVGLDHNGERAEEQASAVAIALAATGDRKFAAALARQSDPVKQAVYTDVHYLWTHYGLRYPRTQKLLRKYG
jgi:hypothetical protein